MKFRDRIGNLTLSFAAVAGHILVLQMGLSMLAMAILSVAVGVQMGAGVSGGADMLAGDTDMIMTAVWQLYLKQAPFLLVGVHTMTLAVYGMWMILIQNRQGEGARWGLLTAPVYPLAVGAVIVMGLGMSLFSNGFGVAAGFIMPEAARAFEEAMEAAGMGENMSVLSLVAAVLLAPVGEELLCRGVAFHYARKAFTGMKSERAAFWMANVIQAFLFGLFHLVLIQAIYAFVLGLVLGWLREHYKSLYPCMIAHLTVNLFSVAAAGLLGLIPGIDTLPGGGLLMMVGICLFAGMGRFIEGRDRRRTLRSS